MGMQMPPIATLLITPFKKVKKTKVLKYCPKCQDQIPKYHQEYTCPQCNTKYSSWAKLIRKTKGGKVITRKKYTEKDKDVIANVYMMDKVKFSVFADATVTEYGVVIKDQVSGSNLKKLLVASKALNKVIIVTYYDVYEKVIAILTTTVTGRIILRQIVPKNLLQEKDTMKFDTEDISKEDIEETKALIKIIPTAGDEQLTTDDYRTIGLDEMEEEEQKVIQLEHLLAKLKGKKKGKKKEIVVKQ